MHSEAIAISTAGRGTYDITAQIQEVCRAAGADAGLCNIFIHHTSASLIICENADPDVRRDLETLFSTLCPDGWEPFTHTMEGPDDMAAHGRSILTQTALTIPIRAGQCDLGTWQSVYLWEHRTAPHRRRITISILG